MGSLFGEKWPEVRMDAALQKIIKEHPKIDPGYITLATSFMNNKKRASYDAWWTEYQPYADKDFAERFKYPGEFPGRAWEMIVAVAMLEQNKTCHAKYLQEDALVEQLISLLDQIDFNTLGIEQKFEDELKRFNKFQRGVLGIANKGATHADIDLKTYAKYTLKEGTNEERRELMGCFKSTLKITEGVVTIE